MKTKVLLFLLLPLCASAQWGTFRTNFGHVIVITDINKQPLIAESHKLLVTLEYDKATISAILDPKTLDTGNDTLNFILQHLAEPVHLTGKMQIEYINTSNHPPMNFNLEAKVMMNGKEKLYIFPAKLEHLQATTQMSCILTFSFTMRFSDFEIENLPAGIGDEMKVTVNEVVLRRPGS